MHVALTPPCGPCDPHGPCDEALPGAQGLIAALQGLAHAIRGFEEGQARVTPYICARETLMADSVHFFERLMSSLPEVRGSSPEVAILVADKLFLTF
jgi:hypothetical protein